MSILSATILLLTAPAAAQNVGGDFQKLHQWDGGAYAEYFGNSLATAGDVNADGYADVIVGAPFANPGGLNEAGSAYVYSGADGSLLYQWDGANYDHNFGSSVSTAGDFNDDGFDDVIIGAPGATPGGFYEAGSVYIYSGADGSLLHQWDGLIYHANFGRTVSSAGDIDLDGTDDVIIAAPGYHFTSTVGSVFVYSGATGALLLQWDGTDVNSDFSRAASSAGDVNQDGYPDVIVGAPWATGGGPSRVGVAFVYSGLDGSLIHKWIGPSYGSYFAYSVAGIGDINQDGFADVIVGSFQAQPGGLSDCGSAFVYSGKDGAQLYRLDGQVGGDQFGISVASAGDTNKDGFQDMLVGATGADSNGVANTGSAFLYSGKDGSQLHRWNGTAHDGSFGQTVSTAGDLNADGFADILLAAPRVSSGIGTVSAWAFNPFLFSDTAAISASNGGTLNLEIDFPASEAFLEYKVLISSSGTGSFLLGVLIPLTWDALVRDTLFENYPVPNHTDLTGILDVDGNASASLTLPAGIPSSLIGNTYHIAAVANTSGQLPEISSSSIHLTIVP